MDKKRERLGMNPSTAHRRLLKDLLFKFVIDSGHKCFRCNKELTKETFSIDHIKPWLNSETPKELFFDLNNIAFSHIDCNREDRADRNRKYFTPEEVALAKKMYAKKSVQKNYTPERRRAKYLRCGN